VSRGILVDSQQGLSEHEVLARFGSVFEKKTQRPLLEKDQDMLLSDAAFAHIDKVSLG